MSDTSNYEKLEHKINELYKKNHALKRANKILSEESRSIKALLNAPTESAVLADLEGNILAINEVASKRLNRTSAELVNSKIFDYFPADVARSRVENQKEVVRTGKPVRFRDERDGRIYDIHIYPVFGEQKKVTALAVYANDITEALEYKNKLIESEAKYRILVETMNDGLGITDENGLITYVNDKYCELIKYPKNEIIGKKVTDFLDDENREIFKNQLAERKKGIFSSYEIAYTRSDGNRLHAIISTRPVFDKNNNFKGAFAVITEIENRKRMEEQLRESEERYRELVEHSPDAITVIQDNQHKLINSEFTRLFGYTSNDIDTGLNAIEIVSASDHKSILDRIRKRTAGEEIFPEKLCIDFIASFCRKKEKTL